ncbi:MAG: hypothetical protein JWN25_736, partial [Verrucomicrobiales bacterium]|nr:hypothetical protein [Verrucomicrobiales bacterium]
MDVGPHHTRQIMESKSQFDLNQAISQWRLSLAGSPAFKIENLDELEAHLRDSAVALQSAELTAEESFSLALGRLGDRAQLENEYGKMNLRQLWLNRCLWIVAGVLLNFFFAKFNQFALTVGCEMAVLRGMDSHLASPLYNLVSAMLPFCEFVLFWKFCLPNRNWGRTVSNLITVHPILSGLAVSTFLFGVHFASGHPHEAMDMIYPLSRSHGPSFHVNWYTENFTDRWIFYLQPLLWMTFVPQIAAYTFRLRKGRDHRKIVLFDQVIWMGAGIVLEKFVFMAALYPSWRVLFAGWLQLVPVPIYWHVLSCLLAGVSIVMPILVIKFAWYFVGIHKNHRSLKWLGLSFA